MGIALAEIALAVYLFGFALMLGYEWQIGPYSTDYCDSAIPGWACAVAWPIVITTRALRGFV